MKQVYQYFEQLYEWLLGLHERVKKLEEKKEDVTTEANGGDPPPPPPPPPTFP